VARFISEHFIPVKIHIKERPKDFERFKAEWTPTVIIAEPDGTERYRFSGFLPKEDFLAQLQFGLAKAAFSRSDFEAAHRGFEEVLENYPRGELAPESVYWAGVSQYKGTGKPEYLAETGKRLEQAYPDSSWAKKGSVWLQ
jgi:TolA-binding protein